MMGTPDATSSGGRRTRRLLDNDTLPDVVLPMAGRKRSNTDRPRGRLGIIAHLQRDGDSLSHMVDVVNVSRTGMLLDHSGVNKRVTLPPGTVIRLELLDPCCTHKVRVSGTVLRTDDEAQRVAVLLDELDGRTVAKLEDVIRASEMAAL